MIKIRRFDVIEIANFESTANDPMIYFLQTSLSARWIREDVIISVLRSLDPMNVNVILGTNLEPTNTLVKVCSE